MPEIPNRDKIDAALTLLLATELDRQRLRLLALLGDPPNPANVPQAYWGQLAAAVHHTLYHDLELAYTTAARQQSAEFGTPLDDAELAAAATQWASDHVGELAIRFVNKTQEAVTEKVREYQAEEEKRKAAIAALLLLTDYRHPWSILGLPAPEPIKLPKPPAEMTPAERAAELNKIEAGRRDWMGRYLDVPFGPPRAEKRGSYRRHDGAGRRRAARRSCPRRRNRRNNRGILGNQRGCQGLPDLQAA